MKKPRILILDVETAPNKGYIWSLWNEVRSMSFIEKDWFIMCWSAKWLGENKIYSSSIADFKEYKTNPENDKKLMEGLWELLDQADIVIAHNGIRFDKRRIQARFIYHRIKIPSPYRMIDTLPIARYEFCFTSNKLNDIAQFLGVGRKNDTNGFQLWKDCLENKNKSAWYKMKKYNQQDVVLLERVYLVMRPFIRNHPNIGVMIDEEKTCCPKCGSDKIHYRGYTYTNSSVFHQFSCTNCGGWGRDRTNCLDKNRRKSLATNVL